MARPPLEVADLIRAAGDAFLERNRHWLRWKHSKVLLAIRRCRTAALGGHLDECTRCGHRAPISYNSCRDRHCPKCQTAARDRWIAARRRELLPTRYLHVVFTLPGRLAPLVLQNRRSSTAFCSVAVPKPFSKWLAIPDTSAQRSVSSSCCVSQEDGQPGSPGAISSSWTNRGVLSRLDQEQVGAAAVPCAGPGEGPDGNAVGLPHLQPAAVDPPQQAQQNTSRYLREQEISAENRNTHPKSQIQ
jgi:hypothetical protein